MATSSAPPFVYCAVVLPLRITCQWHGRRGAGGARAAVDQRPVEVEGDGAAVLRHRDVVPRALHGGGRAARVEAGAAGPVLDAAEGLRRFDGPAASCGRARAVSCRPSAAAGWPSAIPLGELVETSDGCALIPLDRPMRLSAVIRSFAGDAGGA